MEDSTKDNWRRVIQEYDRLVVEEKRNFPIKAAFLPRGYYVRMIAINPEFGYTESYIYSIIKNRRKAR